jgi:GWxTD domain-containing protein
MIRFLSTVLFLLPCLVSAQALRDINFNYLYDPGTDFTLNIEPVRLADQWLILYDLQIRDSLLKPEELSIEWQIRESVIEKNYQPLDSTIRVTSVLNRSGKSGTVSLSPFPGLRIIAAKVVDTQLKKAWFFYKALEEKYPVNNFLSGNNLRPHASVGATIPLGDASTSWIISYYNDNFPPAVPAFSISQAKVSKGMQADSIFTLNGGAPVQFFSRGLFLLQKDTLAAEGFAVRAEEDYPRYQRVQNLFGPLIYICTKAEYDNLEQSNGQKKVFDKTILAITGDMERAKKLIKNYFRRVELANLYFTSYKEGWKTDRGMIYIIFGLPDEVRQLGDREIWNYSNPSFNTSFEFTKSSSVFDPDNYVLIRDTKYQKLWYEIVDLWRKARF